MAYLADCSLSLINQTGAHFVAREILDGLPHHFSAIRYWRFLRKEPPRGLMAKILGRLMLLELAGLNGSAQFRWPDSEPRPGARLFLDPLYVLRSGLDRSDIVLCHDIGPVSHPALFDASTTALYERAYDRIRKTGPGMVFVSEASKEAFAARYGREFRFLTAIPLFVRALGAGVPERPVKGLEPPFLLTVGAFERRKNLPLAIEAFARSGLADEGVRYVLCGAHGLDWERVYEAAGEVPNVWLRGYVGEGELAWLYRNASGFVLPSLLEGFGMPALEAAAHGLVPVISAGGALEEAVRGLGIPVDPGSAEDVARGMKAVVGMTPEERAARADSLVACATAASRLSFIERWDDLLKRDAANSALRI